jgi:hypothetical protein
MMLGKPPDTSDFDTILTTPPWELVTGYLTGEIKPMAHGIYRFDRVRTHIVPREALPKDTSDRFQYPVAPPIFAPVVIELDFVTLCGAAQVAEMAFLGGVEKRVVRHETVASYSLDERYIDAILQELEIESRYTEMPVVGQLGFSQEQLRVYTLWLHYLAKGPGISRLVGETPTKKVSRELNRRLQIVCELREWVKNHELAKGSSCLLPNANDLDFLDYLDREYKLKPVELLKKAGYEV